MITDLDSLIRECEETLNEREYLLTYQCRIKTAWEALAAWMRKNGIEEFSEAVGFRYADEMLGGHFLSADFPRENRIALRAVRMLTSYQKDGDFEYRTPAVERHLDGPIGLMAQEYLLYLRTEQNLSENTVSNKELYLMDFCEFMNSSNLEISDISAEVMDNFFSAKGYSLSSRHNCGGCLKLFFRYLFDHGYSETDCSIYIMADAYRKNNKIPTTYTEDEIKRMIASVERGSAIGKRDYLILLLAAEYGWRSGDITHFRFEHIDWDHNVIRFDQSKTGAPVEFPLLASVGNAIIDYLKHGRPETDVPEVIVSLTHASLGQPLSSPTIHSIVARYMKAAHIENWSEKRHGAHALRHSLATNMLKKNVTLPVISTVMGHQTTETTKIYLKVDVNKLSECPLKMPPIHSPHYGGGASV